MRLVEQHVDDVGPVVASVIVVAEQLGGDRVAVGLVADQNAAEVDAGARVEGLEERAKVIVSHD